MNRWDYILLIVALVSFSMAGCAKTMDTDIFKEVTGTTGEEVGKYIREFLINERGL